MGIRYDFWEKNIRGDIQGWKSNEPIVNTEVEPRRSQRSRISKSFSLDFIEYAIESEPQTFKEAMFTPEAQMWKEVINSEIERRILCDSFSWIKARSVNRINRIMVRVCSPSIGDKREISLQYYTFISHFPTDLWIKYHF